MGTLACISQHDMTVNANLTKYRKRRNCAKARYTQQDEIAGTEETLQDEFDALHSSVHIFLPSGALIRESHTHMVALGVCWSV